MIDSGYKGVDIFFVISGFVMYYTMFSKKRPAPRVFIIHRLSKIFFLYWVALVLLYVVLPYKIDLSFIKTFLLIPGHLFVLNVSWSLSYELYFYFLLGMIVYLIPSKYYKAIFCVLFVISSSITFIHLTNFYFNGGALNFLLGQNLWEFLLGVLSGFIFSSSKKMNPIFFLTIAIVSCVLLLAIDLGYGSPLSYIVYGLLSFGIVSCITIYEKNVRINTRVADLFKVLGDASYAIYLFGPIITVAITVSNDLSKAAIILTTIGVSILFNQEVEAKFLQWVREKVG
jgi:exopolysaccharide production protein ExoZ